LNLFASYSRGFRSGGFNQTGVGAVASAGGFSGVGDLFDQETADTFEAGFKSTFMDGRVNLNASTFFTRSEGSYFFVFLAANSTQNLGTIDEVEYTGIDIELNAELTEGLRLNAGFGYTDSEITEFPDPVAIGAKAPQVSDYTVNIGLEYTTPITDQYDAFFRVDYNRLGDTTFTIPFSAPELALDATPVARDPVDLVDVRASIRSDSWAFTVWAKNLFDTQYNAEYSAGGFLFHAQPQRWGADISYRF
jgi:iron complex outermembrane receptor protein